MDVLSESLNRKIEEIRAKIQKINYIQEFDKAKQFEKIFLQTQENIKLMRQEENQTHLYYYEAMNALEAIDFEIDDYMEKEGKAKEQELNRTIFLGKLKQFIDNVKTRSSETMLVDLREMVREMKELEIEEGLFSELYDLTAKALLCTFMKQAQNNEFIDLGLVDEVTTAKAFAKEIQTQLVKMAEEQKEDKVASYDILKVCQEVNEQNIGDLKIWKTLSGKREVKIKQPEPEKELSVEESQEKQLISLEPKKRTIVDKLRDVFSKKDGTTIYTFGKWNRETGQYENIRVESHAFPPKGKSFIKRCQSECIGLEINDVDIVEIAIIDANMPQLQSLNFGKNVHEIRRGNLNHTHTALANVKTVEFSEDVERLGDNSFSNCSGVSDIKLGENIEQIGVRCFGGCGVESVTLPDKVSEVREFVFGDCKNLQNVKLPESLSKIKECAFQGCENLQTINFPDKLSEIGESAFERCAKLDNVKLPENLLKLGRNAFCSLKNDIASAVHIPSKVNFEESVDAFRRGVYIEYDGETYKTQDKELMKIFRSAKEYYKNVYYKNKNREENDPRMD